ncbi:hypothetical protein [Streptomyces sp. NPDC048172]|uniref:hypothetical protein n=1 Tax=Streptomyces sp. NPDC048172 TaxID=3365505 RepID=UPI00371DD453
MTAEPSPQQPHRQGPDGAGAVTVVAVLAPVLAALAGGIFLLVGYLFGPIFRDPVSTDTLVTTGWFFALGGLIASGVAAGTLFGMSHRNARAHRTREPSGRSLGLASLVAGRRRPHLRGEWAAVLAGEDGEGLPGRRRRRLVAGFLLAAVRMRLRDLAEPLWRPFDWLLAVEARTNAANAAAVGALVVYIHATDGLHTLLTEGWAWCAGCGVAVRMLFAWLRRVRGIELAARPTDDS